ncbi:MAG: murein biosynthesis integral membrane protein MurJ [Beijerinckiaceae bacterium]|nr:murein biosynthesis integral membrane protein MurJ [Beijerinckiaceae bacterium]MCZ8300474.1 murein biosynthesis integral membrane protein MurJ [Beijerinckiaceae bacterium]
MSLALPFTIVGSATLASRVTGFLRDVMIAAALGTGPIADIYVAAFLIPNLIRKMVSEGAFNASLVPRLARLEREGGQQAMQGFFEDLLSILLVATILLVLLAELFMPQVMTLLAHGFAADPGKLDNAVLFGRIAFPFVGFVILGAAIAALLNALDRFALAALVPLTLNLMMILVLAVILAGATAGPRESGLVLVSTVLVAGLVQLIMLWLAARRLGLALSPRPWDALAGRIDPGAWSLLMRMLPAMVVAGSGHVHMVMASQTASLEPRILSMLYFADRLFQLPLGFVASAIGIVLLPHVSRGFQQGDGEAMAQAQTESVIFAALLIFPATIGLWILAEPIVSILFRHGAFLAEDARHTARILKVLVLALPAFVLIKVVLPAFLAREEMGRPVLAALLALAVNGIAAWFLRTVDPVLAAPGGVVAGVWVNTLLLLAMARGRLAFQPRAGWRVAATLLCALAMGWCIHAILPHATPLLEPGRGFGLRVAVLAALCLGGILVFGVLTRLMGVYSLAAIRRQARSS